MSSRTRIASRMWGPLLSITHSARSPIAASVISAREGAPVLAQAVEHLRRPDHRQVRGLAEPEDLLLDLREPLVPALHGEVAAGDHDADRRAAHRGEEQVREHLEAAPGLDLENDAEVGAAEAAQEALSSIDVLGPLREREAHQVGVPRDEAQVLAVLLRKRRQPEIRVRQVDPLLAAQLARPGAGGGDLDRDGGAVRAAHHAADAPVVEPDPVPRARPARTPAAACSRSSPAWSRGRPAR